MCINEKAYVFRKLVEVKGFVLKISFRSRRVQLVIIVVAAVVLVTAASVLGFAFLHATEEKPLVGGRIPSDDMSVQTVERHLHTGFVGFLDFAAFLDITVRNANLTKSYNMCLEGSVVQDGVRYERWPRYTISAGETITVRLTFDEVTMWDFDPLYYCGGVNDAFPGTSSSVYPADYPKGTP